MRLRPTIRAKHIIDVIDPKELAAPTNDLGLAKRQPPPLVLIVTGTTMPFAHVTVPIPVAFL